MKNSDLPAMPQSNIENLCRQTGTPHWMHCGLTKREMFAMAAMQGLCAHSGDYHLVEHLASDALIYADALLDELDRTK